MIDLPVLPSEPTCPVAWPIRGVSRAMQGVVCRLMEDDVQEDAGLRMTPRALEILRESEGGVYLNLKSDPSTVTAFCHGNALPRVSRDESARAHYTFCPVWEAYKERQWAGEDGLYDELEPEPVAMGVAPDGEEVPLQLRASHLEDDPWAAARAGLDELAPPTKGRLAA